MAEPKSPQSTSFTDLVVEGDEGWSCDQLEDYFRSMTPERFAHYFHHVCRVAAGHFGMGVFVGQTSIRELTDEEVEQMKRMGETLEAEMEAKTATKQ